MIGAIIGDIIGSRFEWDNIKSKDFELFTSKNKFTDDTVMTCAIAQALMEWIDHDKNDDLSVLTTKWMQLLGRKYPQAGYGGHFYQWLFDNDPIPYNSYGNGSGMRVSACAWVADSLKQTLELAKKVSLPTHNHPEGIKGAQAIASAIYLAKTGKDKQYIKKYIVDNFYKLDFDIDSIRDSYQFDVTCQGSVPVAIEAFLESNSFEDCIRIAVSVGGDCDTITDMACAIAQAYYPMDKNIQNQALKYLDDYLKNIVKKFEKYIKK